MSATISKLNLVKNIDDPDLNSLNKKANNLFKLGVGVSVFSTGALCATSALDLANIIKVSTKTTTACGLGMFAGMALMLTSAFMQKQVEKRASGLQDKEQKVDNKFDKVS